MIGKRYNEKRPTVGGVDALTGAYGGGGEYRRARAIRNYRPAVVLLRCCYITLSKVKTIVKGTWPKKPTIGSFRPLLSLVEFAFACGKSEWEIECLIDNGRVSPLFNIARWTDRKRKMIRIPCLCAETLKPVAWSEELAETLCQGSLDCLSVPAVMWSMNCSQQHVLDLLQDGALLAVDKVRQGKAAQITTRSVWKFLKARRVSQ